MREMGQQTPDTPLKAFVKGPLDAGLHEEVFGFSQRFKTVPQAQKPKSDPSIRLLRGLDDLKLLDAVECNVTV